MSWWRVVVEEAWAGDDWWWRFVLVVRDDAGLSWG